MVDVANSSSGLFMEDIQIHGFRGLSGIELASLSRVNLLVGKNDSGKTSVLEAFAIFASPLDMREWANVALARQGRAFFPGMGALSSVEAIRWMFPHDPGEVSGDEAHQPIEITASGRVAHRRLLAGCLRLRGIPPKADQNQSFSLADLGTRSGIEDFVEDEGWLIRVETIDDQGNVFPVSGKSVEFPLWERLGLRFQTQKGKRGPDVVLLSPYAHRDQILNLRLLTRAIVDDQRSELANLLGRLDDNIRGIEIISTSDGSRPAIAIRYAHSGVLPLGILGDGVRRALSIALAIRKARNGLLLIDEIESALHVSTLNTLFPWMVEACETHNVQVVATTHSLEAIDSIAALAADGPARDIAAYHLAGPSEGAAAPRRYTGGMLRRLVHEQGLDVR